MDIQLKKSLEENEVDIVGTLARFMQNENLYVKFLYKFLEDENFIGLKESLEKKDFDEAFKFAHTLKGVSANLGLNSIYKPLTALVERLRNKDYGDEMDEWFQKTENGYLKLRESLLSLER